MLTTDTDQRAAQPFFSEIGCTRAGPATPWRSALPRAFKHQIEGFGHTDNLELPGLYLHREWLPASGEEAWDFSLYCQRLAFFPEVPEHEAVADLLLSLK